MKTNNYQKTKNMIKMVYEYLKKNVLILILFLFTIYAYVKLNNEIEKNKIYISESYCEIQDLNNDIQDIRSQLSTLEDEIKYSKISTTSDYEIHDFSYDIQDIRSQLRALKYKVDDLE